MVCTASTLQLQVAAHKHINAVLHTDLRLVFVTQYTYRLPIKLTH